MQKEKKRKSPAKTREARVGVGATGSGWEERELSWSWGAAALAAGVSNWQNTTFGLAGGGTSSPSARSCCSAAVPSRYLRCSVCPRSLRQSPTKNTGGGPSFPQRHQRSKESIYLCRLHPAFSLTGQPAARFLSRLAPRPPPIDKPVRIPDGQHRHARRGRCVACRSTIKCRRHPRVVIPRLQVPLQYRSHHVALSAAVGDPTRRHPAAS